MIKKILFCFVLTVLVAAATFPAYAAAQPRHAPNMYVDWPDNGDYDIMMVDWYCEQDGNNTYWAVHNWNGGYAGFQNAEGNHKLLLSLWDMDDGTRPTVEYAMDGKSGDFGGEGTGKQVFTDYKWQTGKWYTMRVQVWTENGKSCYGQWIREGDGDWIKTAVISYPKPNLKFDKDSMFQEDFTFNNVTRKCRLKNAYGRIFGKDKWESWNNFEITNTYFPTDPPSWDNVQWNVTYDTDWGKASDGSYVWIQSGGASDFTSNRKIIPVTYSVSQAANPTSPDVSDASLLATQPTQPPVDNPGNNIPDYEFVILAGYGDYALEVVNGGLTGDHNIQVYTFGDVAWQWFETRYTGDGYYLVAPKSGWVATVDSAGNVYEAPATEKPNQKWYIVQNKAGTVSDGSYAIISVADGRYLTVDGDAIYDGANVCVKGNNNSANQKWYLTEPNDESVRDPLIPNLDSASSWARDSIRSAISKGYVPIEIQGNYTSVITRLEFCRMAVKWLEYATGKNIDTIMAEKGVSRNLNIFTDTSDRDILAAYALGITNGTSSNTFTPNGKFSREQAATMIRNTCKVLGVDTDNSPASGFSDLNNASSWAVDGINFCRANGIMNGTSTVPLLFSPKATYTRQESIVTFSNIKLEPTPEQIDDSNAVDLSVSSSQFVWEVGSGGHIAIGQTKEQIDSILGESPEIPNVFEDMGDGMYRAKYEYSSAGGITIEYNRAGEAVVFYTENAAVTDFLGIQMGSSSDSVFGVLKAAFGEEKINKNSGGYTYIVYFDADGYALEWTTQIKWSYALHLHCGEVLDIMQIYWIEGTYKQTSDCRAGIVGKSWEFGYVLDSFGGRHDAGDFFGTALSYGTSLVFNEDNTFEYWIGFYDGYGTYATDGNRILLTYEGSRNGNNNAGDTGMMIYYSNYTNPYDGTVTPAVSLDFMAWDTASMNNKPYCAFFVNVK